MPNPLYIKYIGFGLGWFHGISIIVGYLMPITLYSCKIYRICEHVLLITFLNEFEFNFFVHTVRLSSSFTSNKSFVCSQF